MGRRGAAWCLVVSLLLLGGGRTGAAVGGWPQWLSWGPLGARAWGTGEEDPASGVTWLVHVTDIHLSDHVDIMRLSDIGQLVRLSTAPLMIATGDLCDGKSKSRLATRQLSREWRLYDLLMWSLPEGTAFYDLPGNHDAFGVPDRGGASDLYAKYGGHAQAALRAREAAVASGDAVAAAAPTPPQPRVRTVMHGGIAVVLLDATASPGANRPYHLFGRITRSLLEELDAALGAVSAAQVTLVFGHYPSPFLDHLDLRARTPRVGAAKREELWAMLSRHNVTAYLCGHTHRPVMRARHGRDASGLPHGPWELQLASYKEDRAVRLLMAHAPSGRVAVADALGSSAAFTSGRPIGVALPTPSGGIVAGIVATLPVRSVGVRASRAPPGLSLAEGPLAKYLAARGGADPPPAPGSPAFGADLAGGATVALSQPPRPKKGSPWSAPASPSLASVLSQAASTGQCELELVVTASDGTVHVLPPQECYLGAWEYGSGVPPRHGSLAWVLGWDLPRGLLRLYALVVWAILLGLAAPKVWLWRSGAAQPEALLARLLKPPGGPGPPLPPLLPLLAAAVSVTVTASGSAGGAAGAAARRAAPRVIASRIAGAVVTPAAWAWWGACEACRPWGPWLLAVSYVIYLTCGHWVGLPWYWCHLAGDPGRHFAPDKLYPSCVTYGTAEGGATPVTTAEPLPGAIAMMATVLAPLLAVAASHRAARRLAAERAATDSAVVASAPRTVRVGWWALQALGVYSAVVHARTVLELTLNYGPLAAVGPATAGLPLVIAALVYARPRAARLEGKQH